jgi:uncharacterized protein HemY
VPFTAEQIAALARARAAVERRDAAAAGAAVHSLLGDDAVYSTSNGCGTD